MFSGEIILPGVGYFITFWVILGFTLNDNPPIPLGYDIFNQWYPYGSIHPRLLLSLIFAIFVVYYVVSLKFNPGNLLLLVICFPLLSPLVIILLGLGDIHFIPVILAGNLGMIISPDPVFTILIGALLLFHAIFLYCLGYSRLTDVQRALGIFYFFHIGLFLLTSIVKFPPRSKLPPLVDLFKTSIILVIGYLALFSERWKSS